MSHWVSVPGKKCCERLQISHAVFIVWSVAALALVYTGSDTWRELLNGPEKVFLPLFVISGYSAVWAASGFAGRAAAALGKRGNPESAALFARLAFILPAEGYWQLRNHVLPALPLVSPVKMAALPAVVAAGVAAAWIVTKAAAGPGRGNGRGGRFSSRAGAAAVVVFAVAAFYVYGSSAWSFHLFQPAHREPGDPAAPNLVIVTLDTTSANFTSLHGFGDATTPELERLAGQGVTFANALAPMPVTGPSHASIMTGLIPRVHGVVDNGSRTLGDRFITLAEILSERGRQTAQFVNFQVCSAPGGLHQGFSTAFSSFTDMAPFRNAARRATLFDASAHLLEKVRRRNLRAAPEDENYALVRGWIRGEAAPPFFLWYHIFVPHVPYTPPPGAMADLGYRVPRPFDVDEIVALMKKGASPEPARVAELRTLYAAEVYQADRLLGRLIGDLEAAGFMENTLLVAAGDHGEAIYEHDNKIGHVDQVYDSVARVPCVLWRPGRIPRRLKIERPVSLTDLFPTVLDLLGIPPPEGINGKSLAGLIYGGESAEPPADFVVTETMPPASKERVISARRGNFHYIEWPGGKRRELYDTEADPFERVDLADRPEMAEKVRIAHDYLEEWVRKYPVEPPGEMKSADPALLKQLKNLGYVR